MKQPLCLLLLPAALSVKCKRQLLLLLGLLRLLLHAINLLMKTGNKLGQLRPKGRRQTDKNPTPSAKKCAKELINKAVEHVGISISTSLPPPSLYLCLPCAWSTLHLHSVHSAKRTSYLLRMRARARCLMRAATPASTTTSTWPHVLALRQRACASSKDNVDVVIIIIVVVVAVVPPLLLSTLLVSALPNVVWPHLHF